MVQHSPYTTLTHCNRLWQRAADNPCLAFWGASSSCRRSSSGSSRAGSRGSSRSSSSCCSCGGSSSSRQEGSEGSLHRECGGATSVSVLGPSVGSWGTSLIHRMWCAVPCVWRRGRTLAQGSVICFRVPLRVFSIKARLQSVSFSVFISQSSSLPRSRCHVV